MTDSTPIERERADVDAYLADMRQLDSWVHRSTRRARFYLWLAKVLS